MSEWGGYVCPIPGCPFKAVVANLLERHMRKEHPETEEW